MKWQDINYLVYENKLYATLLKKYWFIVWQPASLFSFVSHTCVQTTCLFSPSQPSASLRARTLVLAVPRHHLTFICLLQHSQPLTPAPAALKPNFPCVPGKSRAGGLAGSRCPRATAVPAAVRERGWAQRARCCPRCWTAALSVSPRAHRASPGLGPLAASRLSRGTGNKSGRLPTPAGTSARLSEARELPWNTKGFGDRGQ